MVSSELARRTLFAVVAAPLGVALVYLGGAVLAALLSCLAAVAAWELFRIARAGDVAPLRSSGVVLAAAVPLAVHAGFLGLFPRLFALSHTLIVLAALGLFAVTIRARGARQRPLAVVAVTAFGVLYTGGTLSFGYALRYHPYAVGAAAGTALAALPLAVTWATDIGAYAVGRLAGRRKLMPSVSPGKTVEGALGGLLCAVAVCWVYVPVVLRPAAQLALAPLPLVAFAVLASVAAQIGDLGESLLKREAGVKDSSAIIPGHGGLLDRFDSVFFVLPVAYLLLGLWLVPAPG